MDERKTILLVEDEALIALAESRMLARQGYEVVTVHSGEAAVDAALNRSDVDLILMDINLGPGIDGTQAATKILAERDIPLVFLSSHTDPATVERTEGITSYGYIVKNSGETVLLASIRMAFRLHETRRREKQLEGALRALAESGGAREEGIFHFLVRELALSLHTACALIAEIDPADPERATTLAVWNDGEWQENFSYSLSGTPCRNVTAQGACLYPDRICERFPEDEILITMGAESYWGAPLRTESGETVGLIAVIDARPLAVRDWYLPLLESYAIRAAQEVSRNRQLTELVRREEYLQATLASIGDAVISTDSAGRIRGMNRVAEELTGWPLEEALNRDTGEVLVLLDAEKDEPMPNPVLRALSQGRAVGLENGTRLAARDGGFIFVADSCAPIIDRNGTTAGAILVFRDVSQEYRRQNQLERISHQLGERVKELACLYGLFRLVEQPEITQAGICRGALDLLQAGWQYPEHTRARIRIEGDEFAQEDFSAVEHSMHRDLITESGRVGSIEVGYLPGSGALAESPFLPEEEELLSAVADQLACSLKRRRDEERLAFQATLLDALGQAVIVTGPGGKVTYANRAAEELFGWKAAEVMGRDIARLTPSEEMAGRAEEIMRTLGQGDSWTGEFLLRKADGEQFPAIVSDTPVFGSDGDLKAIIGITTDVSEIKSAEQRIRTLLAEKELILRELNHRIKNNIGSVHALLQLQAEQSEHPVASAELTRAASRIYSIQVLYEQLNRTGASERLESSAYFRALADKIAELNGREGTVQLVTEFEELVLPIDRLAVLGTILNELVTNAYKYAFPEARSGTIGIRIGSEEESIVLQVSDDGSGMLETEESGFGLSLVRLFVEQLEGSLMVESPPGEGTRFTVRVPLDQVASGSNPGAR